MGEVFLALSRSSLLGVNKLVVIKRLRHFAEDEARSEARQMFLNEARLATLLNHPNIGIPGPYPDFGPFFGKAFSAGDPRRMQFALRFDF